MSPPTSDNSENGVGSGRPHASYGDDDIDGLVSAGLKEYALKNYDEAVDKLGRACELHAERKGGENAQLLFTYGRALFSVAVANSEVLGDKAASASADPGASGTGTPGANPNFTFEEDDVVAETAAGENDGDNAEAGDNEGNEEEEGEGADADANQTGGEQQDDFEDAWEVLDLARKLLSDDLTNDPDNIETKKQLAETYDLLGEVSLESENFKQAVVDLTSSLELRQQLYPEGAPAISESHYKLSLAHEFDFEDPECKTKAIDQMDKAIASVRLRENPDVEITKELETRLAELKADTRSVEAAKADVLDGLVGATTGEIKAQLVQAISSANDVSGLIRKKKRKPESDPRPITTASSGGADNGEITKKPKVGEDNDA